MLRRRIRILLFLFPLLAIQPFSQLHGEEPLLRSELGIAGQLPASDLEFYAVEEKSSRIVIEIALGLDTVLSAEIDHDTRSYSVRSLSRSRGETAALSAADLLALRDLAARLNSREGALAEQTLGRLLNLLHDYPAEEVVDLSVVKSLDEGFSEKTIKSLCGTTGSRTKGTYTVEEDKHTETAQVGPCYFRPAQGNHCLGRCGPGCGAPPEPTFQQFAQDCFNHDLCTGFTGTILGECADEWGAAADDFLFASDCADLDGRWLDNFKYQYSFSQGGHNVSGSVKGRGAGNVECRTWSITGTHNDDQVNFKASNIFQRQGCCSSFTMSGKAQSCSKIAGSWTNACGARGTFTMNRQRRKEDTVLLLSEDGEEIMPGSVKQ